jgi:hypothetical protein
MSDLIEAILITLGDLFGPRRPRSPLAQGLLVLGLFIVLAIVFVLWRNWDMLVAGRPSSN